MRLCHTFYDPRRSKSHCELWDMDYLRLYDSNNDFPLLCILHCRFHCFSHMFANEIQYWQPDCVPASDEDTVGYEPHHGHTKPSLTRGFLHLGSGVTLRWGAPKIQPWIKWKVDPVQLFVYNLRKMILQQTNISENVVIYIWKGTDCNQ